MPKPILMQSEENDLRKECATVTVFDAKLRALLDDMWDSMYSTKTGVGLAATQIGVFQRVAVIDVIRSERSHRRLELVNPRIVSSEGEQTGKEGCLSIPGQHWDITRAMWVKVEYQDANGNRLTMATKGLLARAIQHECDHLNGILCITHAKVDPSPGEIEVAAKIARGV